MSLLKTTFKDVAKTDLITIPSGSTISEAAQKMEHISSILVEKEGDIVGIVTEKDVMQRAVAQSKSCDTTTVDEIMTKELICGEADMSIVAVAHKLHENGIKKLILQEEGKVVGIISQTDIVRILANDSLTPWK